MKKQIITSIYLTIFIVAAFMSCGLAAAQTSPDAKVDVLVLLPGDSRSIAYEFDDTMGSPEGYHVALISAAAPDREIHQLAINISPLGDVAPQVAYFSWGIFFSFTGGVFDFIEMLDPTFTYGFNSVNYIVDINPYMSIGIIYSAAVSEFSGFDFPLEMTMTATLSN